MLHSELYSTDAKGNIRTWRVEQLGDHYRTISGIFGKKLVESGWIATSPKNVGKSNETDAHSQANSEVASLYELKEKENYFRDISQASKVKFVEPMLAQKYSDKPFTQKDIEDRAFVQPKLDGIRAVTSFEKITSRNGREIVSVPHVLNSLSDILKYNNFETDGELYNHEFREDFNTITSIVKKTKPTKEDLFVSAQKIEYHVYDIISTTLTFEQRLSKLELLKDIPGIVIVPTRRIITLDEVDEAFSEYVQQGYEGLIARRNGVYEHKRSKNLLKYKEFLDEEFTLINIEEGQGVWAGKAKRVVCRDDKHDIVFEAGVKGTFEFTAQLLRDVEKYVNKPVTIRYFNRTPDNVPRFGVATAFWPDGKE